MLFPEVKTSRSTHQNNRQITILTEQEEAFTGSILLLIT
jgi:hypothetical protein